MPQTDFGMWHAVIKDGQTIGFALGHGDDVSQVAFDSKSRGHLFGAAENLLSYLENEYAALVHVHNSWSGRDTPEGQAKLCELRDLIATARGVSAQLVQEAYSTHNPKLIEEIHHGRHTQSF